MVINRSYELVTILQYTLFLITGSYESVSILQYTLSLIVYSNHSLEVNSMIRYLRTFHNFIIEILPEIYVLVASVFENVITDYICHSSDVYCIPNRFRDILHD